MDKSDEAALVRDLAVEHRLTSSPAVRAAIEMVCGGLVFCAPTVVMTALGQDARVRVPEMGSGVGGDGGFAAKIVRDTVACSAIAGNDRCILKPGHGGDHMFPKEPVPR